MTNLHPLSWRRWALLDRALTAYYALFVVAVVLGTGPNRELALPAVATNLAVYAAAAAFHRGPWAERFPIVKDAIYRFVIFGSFLIGYLELQIVLPAVTTRVVDAQVYAMDVAIFGFEPALAWDRFVTPARVEWFAFFYYLHFLVLASHVLPLLLCGGRGQLLARFVVGILFVFCVGHLSYLAVPGYGPFWYFRGRFTNEPLEGGTFWSLVRTAVAAGGAGKDIFPSLHTAGPSFVAIFAFMHRSRRPFCWTWAPLAFIAANIIGATLFLRWHYIVDVVAGLALAVTAAQLCVRVADREARHRAATGLPPVFRPLLPNPAPHIFGGPAGPRKTLGAAPKDG
jgi:membrane-associated phospholipid phosphatase